MTNSKYDTREAFEGWLRKERIPIDYQDSTIALCYLAWQACNTANQAETGRLKSLLKNALPHIGNSANGDAGIHEYQYDLRCEIDQALSAAQAQQVKEGE